MVLRICCVILGNLSIAHWTSTSSSLRQLRMDDESSFRTNFTCIHLNFTMILHLSLLSCPNLHTCFPSVSVSHSLIFIICHFFLFNRISTFYLLLFFLQQYSIQFAISFRRSHNSMELLH